MPNRLPSYWPPYVKGKPTGKLPDSLLYSIYAQCIQATESRPVAGTEPSSSTIIASPPEVLSKSPQQSEQNILEDSAPGTNQGKAPESSTRLDAVSPNNEFAPASVAAELIQDRSPASGASPLLGPSADSQDSLTAPGISKVSDAPAPSTPSPSSTDGLHPLDAKSIFSVSTAPIRPPTTAQEIKSPSPSNSALETEEGPASLGLLSSSAPELFTPTQNFAGGAEMPESIPAPATDLSSSNSIARPPEMLSKSPQQPGQSVLDASAPDASQGKAPERSTRLDAASPTNEFAPASVAAEIIQDRSPESGASPLLGPLADSRNRPAAPSLANFPNTPAPSPSSTDGLEPSDATSTFSVPTALVSTPAKAQATKGPSPLDSDLVALGPENGPALLKSPSSLAAEVSAPTQDSTLATTAPESALIPVTDLSSSPIIASLSDTLSESPQQAREGVVEVSGPGSNQGRAPESIMTLAASSPVPEFAPANAAAGLVQIRSPRPMADPSVGPMANSQDSLTARGPNVPVLSPSSTVGQEPSDATGIHQVILAPVRPPTKAEQIQSPSPAAQLTMLQPASSATQARSPIEVMFPSRTGEMLMGSDFAPTMNVLVPSSLPPKILGTDTESPIAEVPIAPQLQPLQTSSNVQSPSSEIHSISPVPQGSAVKGINPPQKDISLTPTSISVNEQPPKPSVGIQAYTESSPGSPGPGFLRLAPPSQTLQAFAYANSPSLSIVAPPAYSPGIGNPQAASLLATEILPLAPGQSFEQQGSSPMNPRLLAPGPPSQSLDPSNNSAQFGPQGAKPFMDNRTNSSPATQMSSQSPDTIASPSSGLSTIDNGSAPNPSKGINDSPHRGPSSQLAPSFSPQQAAPVIISQTPTVASSNMSTRNASDQPSKIAPAPSKTENQPAEKISESAPSNVTPTASPANQIENKQGSPSLQNPPLPSAAPQQNKIPEAPAPGPQAEDRRPPSPAPAQPPKVCLPVSQCYSTAGQEAGDLICSVTVLPNDECSLLELL